MVWMVAFWVLVAALAAAVVSLLFPRNSSREDARRVLRERLARGELGAAEYRERMQSLEVQSRGSQGWASVAVVVLLALVAVWAVLAMGAGWGMHGRWGMPGMPMPHMRGWSPSPAPSARPGGRLLPVELADFTFRPGVVRVRFGEPVNLKLRNTGYVPHDLYVPDLDSRAALAPGQEVVAGLLADRPGTFEFYCTVPGHREAGMRGVLVVSP
ncbi:MAG: cupredoxin domain-containing protein [Armatimonadota bacterium]|nr:cupredoxin domain-containing protein [Armatimonadota bacterium]